jgi:hypothetical protein
MGVTSDPSGNARSGAAAKGEGCGTLFIGGTGRVMDVTVYEAPLSFSWRISGES